MRHVENLVARVPDVQDLWILGTRDRLLHIKGLNTSRITHGVTNKSAAFIYRLIMCKSKKLDVCAE